MNNVIQLFARYGAHILFIVLEVICFNIIINYNKTQKEVFLNSSNLYAGKISEQKAKLSEFASIKKSKYKKKTKQNKKKKKNIP